LFLTRWEFHSYPAEFWWHKNVVWKRARAFRWLCWSVWNVNAIQLEHEHSDTGITLLNYEARFLLEGTYEREQR
jgi:hypothetical protein